MINDVNGPPDFIPVSRPELAEVAEHHGQLASETAEGTAVVDPDCAVQPIRLHASAISRAVYAPRSRQARSGLALLAAALVAAPAALAVTAPSPPGVKVYQGPDRNEIALFHTATCRAPKGRPTSLYFVNSTSTNGSYKLWLTFFKFTGFHDYPLEWANRDSAVDFSIYGPDGVEYSNTSAPASLAHQVGGFVHWAPKGNLLGIGFVSAYSTDLQSAVEFAGGFRCTTPKRGKKKR